MSTVTDSDLQQLKDLIIAGQLATQQQIADGNAATQKQITDLTLEMRVGFAKVDGKFDTLNAEIKGIHTELTDIKSNQKAQDTRFWSLVFLILTTSVGVIGKLAKFY